MRKHEDFEELTALAAIGQLSVEEHAELLEHLRGCAQCRRTSDQFNFILDELPLPEPSASDRDLQQLQAASYRQRFLERASAEGIRFTPEALGEKRGRVATSFFRNWRPYTLGIASAVTVMIVASAVVLPKVLSRLTVRQVTGSNPKPAVAPPVLAGKSSDSSARDSDLAATVVQFQQAKQDAEKRLDSLRRELARAQANYQQLLQESEQWKDQAAQLQSKDQRDEQRLIIMQRLHEDDLVGHVLEQENWEHVRLPAIAEEEETHVIESFIGTRTVRRHVGEPLHPEREPLAVLEHQRHIMGEYNFAGQYQQQPAPLGGGMVKAEWFKFYVPGEEPSAFNMVFQS
jgi:hypothetical protein